MTKRFAVVGDPVAHSLSPLMHAGWYRDHGIEASYDAVRLQTDAGTPALRALEGFAGVNVTLPHKEAAARAADRVDAVVRMLGVANTLTWNDGAIDAANTDYEGFHCAMDEAAPAWRSAGRALVLGAGGAATAVAHAVAAQGGVELTLLNRTLAKAEALAGRVARHCGSPVRARPWESLHEAFSQADVIVNCTSVGLAGSQKVDWPVGAAKESAIVCDIVYRPLETDLLRLARRRGLTTVDGLGMLIHQGALAFELWFGFRPDSLKARERLTAALS